MSETKTNDFFEYRKYEKISKWLILLAINVFFAILYMTLFHAYFETADEFEMAMILSGGRGVSSPLLPFSNILLGRLLWQLSQWFINFNWLFVYYFMCLLVSTTSICYLFLENSHFSKRNWIYVFVFLICVAPSIYVTYQFTRTSIITTMAGFLLLYSSKKSLKSPLFILGIVLSLAGTFLRFGSLYTVLPLFVIFVSFDFLKVIVTKNNKKIIRFLKEIVCPLTLILLALVSLWKISEQMKKTKYSEYFAYMTVRSGVVDFPALQYSQHEFLFEELGLSENDYLLLNQWYFEDPKVFPATVLGEISTVMKQNDFEKTNQLKRNIVQFFQNSMYLFLLGLVALLWFKKADEQLKKGIAALLLYHGLFLGMNLIMGRYTSWVGDPLLLCYIIGMLYLLTQKEVLHENVHTRETTFNTNTKQNKDKLNNFVTIISGLIILLLLHFSLNIQLWERAFKPIDLHAQKYYEQIADDPLHLYILDTSSGVPQLYESMPLYRAVPKGLLSNTIKTGSWLTGHPVNIGQKKAWDTANVMEALLRPNVYFVTTPDRIDNALLYLQEHYNATAYYTQISDSEQFTVYKFHVSN